MQTDITDVDTIAAGGTHVLARKTNGTVWAWGNNNTGQLGNGAAGPGNPKTTATPVQAQDLTDVAALGAGYLHSLAATTESVWSWGANSAGQLGNGTTSPATSPAPVVGLEPGEAAPAVQSSYTYDGDGLRATKTTKDGTQQFTWDTASGLSLLLADGKASYLYGPDGLPVAQIGHDGTVRYYHHDQLGSTRLLTDETGTVVGTTTYDAHGTTTETTGEEPVLGYAGEYTDTETGLIYLRARYYDPTTGQFLTRDPLGAVTREPYGYAGNDPVNFSDPTGLSRCGQLSLGGFIDCAANPTDICIDTGGNDNCDTIAEQNPDVMRDVVNFSGGVLNTNPITAPLPLDLEGHGVDASSGWFSVGHWGMIGAETVVGFGFKSAAAFNTASGAIYASSVCFGIRDGSCGGSAFAVLVGAQGLLGHSSFLDAPFLGHFYNAWSNVLSGLPWSEAC